MSSTTSPLTAKTGSSSAVVSVTQAQTSSASWVSQKPTWRWVSGKNASTSRTAHAVASRIISGRTGSRDCVIIGGPGVLPYQLELALGDVREQVGDGGVHHVD